MTNGGPFGSTRVLSFYMFEESLSEFGFRMGYGAAIAVVLVLPDARVHRHTSCTRCGATKRERTKMFPTPLAKTSREVANRAISQVLLPIMLVIWLLPLIAVANVQRSNRMPTSRTATTGACPAVFSSSFENYGKVFFESNMPRYLLNSLFITIPTVIGAVALSCMAGFALGDVPLQRQPADLLYVHCG